MSAIQVYTNRDGVEHKLIKRNRVNWIMERLSDGARFKGDSRLWTFLETRQVEEESLNPLIRVGALVELLPDCPIVKSGRAKAGDMYVIIGFGQAVNEFKIIEVGGNPRGTYYKSIHARYLTT